MEEKEARTKRRDRLISMGIILYILLLVVVVFDCRRGMTLLANSSLLPLSLLGSWQQMDESFRVYVFIVDHTDVAAHRMVASATQMEDVLTVSVCPPPDPQKT